MTILNIIGQCGPLVGVRLFPKEQGPYYVPGMAICAGFMLGVAVLALILRFYLIRLNGRVGEQLYEMVGMKDIDGGAQPGDALMGVENVKGKDVFRFML